MAHGTATDQAADVRRGGGVALWRQIAERLLGDIAAGRHAPGERLPTEPVLAARFGVNRHTLRRALKSLADEGVLRTVQGSGTYVASRPLAYPIGARTRFSEIVSAQQRAPVGQVLSAVEAAADREVAENLDVPVGAAVWRIESLRSADGAPICIQTAWLPVALCPDLAQKLDRSGSITKALALCGIVDYRRRWTRISARSADARDAFRLDEPAGRAVIQAESLNVTTDGVPLEFSRSRFAADRVEFVVES